MSIDALNQLFDNTFNPQNDSQDYSADNNNNSKLNDLFTKTFADKQKQSIQNAPAKANNLFVDAPNQSTYTGKPYVAPASPVNIFNYSKMDSFLSKIQSATQTDSTEIDPYQTDYGSGDDADLKRSVAEVRYNIAHPAPIVPITGDISQYTPTTGEKINSFLSDAGDKAKEFGYSVGGGAGGDTIYNLFNDALAKGNGGRYPNNGGASNEVKNYFIDNTNNLKSLGKSDDDIYKMKQDALANAQAKDKLSAMQFGLNKNENWKPDSVDNAIQTSGNVAGQLGQMAIGGELMGPLAKLVDNPIASAVIERTLVGGGLGAQDAYNKDANVQDFAKYIGRNALFMNAGGALSDGAGKIGEGILSKAPKAIQNSGLPNIPINALKTGALMGGGMAATIPTYGTNDPNRPTLNDVKNNFIMGGLMGGIPSLPALKEVPDLIMPNKDLAINNALTNKLGDIKAENTPIEPTLNPVDPTKTPLQGKFTVKNTALDTATQNYNDAIQTIQNRFMTNKLTPEEIPLIKSELGIDLPKLADNVATAKTDVAKIADRQRLGLIAGVNELPANKLQVPNFDTKIESPLKPVSDIKPTDTNTSTQPNIFTDSTKKAINIPTVADATPTIPPKELLNTDYSKVDNISTLTSHIDELNKNIANEKSKGPLSMNLQLFSQKLNEANAQLTKLRDVSSYDYVNPKPMDLNIGNTDKATSTDIRQAVSGMRDSQTVAGVQLKKEMQKLAPNEQEGIQLFIDAGGDKKHLQEMANNMDNVDSKGVDSIMDSYAPNSNKVTYREAYNQALNLSPNAMKATEMAQKYYKESGNVAFDLGTTHSIVNDYTNRMWNTKGEGKVPTETWNNGLGTSTSHAKARSLNNIGEGILQGLESTTLNAGDALSIHNQEMGRVNTNMKLANAMTEKGIGSFQKGDIPKGFTPIDSLSSHYVQSNGDMGTKNYIVPDGIAEGIKALTEPNKMWDKLRGLQKYQGVVKTVDLSGSLFHHITLASQMLYNTKGGIDMFRHMKDFTKLDSPGFNAMEKDFVSHTGQTTSVAGNLDTLGHLSGDTSLVDKMTNIPGLKQLKQVSDANTNLLFDKMQRWLKVTDYNNKVLDYVAKHKDNPPTDTQLTQVKRSLAQEINNAYGGLNWDALGVTKTSRAYQSLALLAPDWTNSSIRMATHATGLGKIDSSLGLLKNIGNVVKGDAGVNAARVQTLVGMGGAALLTEGLNHMLTGHFTDKNPKGQELSVEIQPGVYISMFRSGIGDASKLISNIAKTDPLTGAMTSINSKLAPLPRTVIGQLTNKQFNGASITTPKDNALQNTISRLKEGVGTFAPIPFGVTNALKYNNGGEATTLGKALVGSGVATYSKDTSNPNNPTASYKDNWLNKMFGSDPNQSTINSINDFKSQALKDSKATNTQIQTDLKNGIKPTVGTPAQIKIQQKQLTKFTQPALVQSFNSMSKIQQLNYLKLNPDKVDQLKQYVKLK